MSQTKNDEDVHITEKDLPQEFILKALGQHEARGMWGIKNTREPVDAMVKYAKRRELTLPLVQVVITTEGIFVNPISSRFDCEVQEGECINRTLPSQKSDRCKMHPSKEKLEQDRWSSDRNVHSIQKMSTDLSHGFRNREKRTEASIKPNGKFNFVFNKSKDKIRKPPATDLKVLEKFSRFDWSTAGILFFGIDTIAYGVQDLIFTRVFSMIVVLDRQTRAALGTKSSFMCHGFVCDSRTTAKKVTYALAAAFQAYGRAVKHLQENEISKKTTPETKPKEFIIALRPPSEIDFDVSEV